MNKQIIIEINKRYCAYCGKPLLLREVETRFFDPSTGKRITEFRQQCPDFINQKGSFFGKLEWLMHDSIEFVDFVRVSRK